MYPNSNALQKCINLQTYNIMCEFNDSAGCFDDLKQKLEEELLKKKDNGSN